MQLELLLLIPAGLAVLFIHEMGHLLAARRCGVPVARIAIGLGPDVFSVIDPSGTRWSLAALPFGASCTIGSPSRDRHAVKSAGARHAHGKALSRPQLGRDAFICAAGPAFNLVLATAIYLATILYFDEARLWDLDGVKTSAALPMMISWFSLAVGLFNLLPLPPLDGGRLLLIGIQAWRGKPISSVLERKLAAIGHSAVILGAVVASIALLVYL